MRRILRFLGWWFLFHLLAVIGNNSWYFNLSPMQTEWIPIVLALLFSGTPILYSWL